MAVLPHLLRQPGGRLPRVAEDHRLNSSRVKTLKLRNGIHAKHVQRQTFKGGKQLFYKKIREVVIKISVSDSDQDQIQIQSGQWIRIRNLPRAAEDHRLDNSSHVKQYTYAMP